MSGNNQLRIISSFLFTFLLLQLSAQNEIGSPYSAFGMGYLNNVNSIKSMSMGSLSIGTRDNNAINITNPAAYTAFDTASFLFEGGVAGTYTSLKTEGVNENFTNATLSQLTFGFPITHWWKSSVGLVPFSKVGYSAKDVTFQEDIGNITYYFSGDGGTSRVYWGNAIQPLKSLSIGVNVSYLFGTTERIQRVTFPDSAYYINTRVDNSIYVGDAFLEFGAQYFTELKKNIHFVAGLTYRLQANLSSTKEHLVRSSLGEISNVEYFRDTVAYTNEPGLTVLPAGIGAGFSLTKTNHWLFGIDYKYDQWEKYRSFGNSDSLLNSQTLILGGFYIPNYTSNSYFQRIEYRAGVRFYESYLKLRGKQLDGFGITFGLGMPLRSIALKGAKSMINIGAEVGKRGTLAYGLIQENYVNFYVGVSIYEFWFFKRRYK